MSVRGRRKERKATLPSAAMVRATLVAAVLVAAWSCLGTPLQAASGLRGGAAAPAVATPAQQHEGGTLQPETASEASHQPAHGEPAWRVIARLVNFAILVGVLVYYLRAPISNYLERRSTEIRVDLVRAAETHAAAAAQLASIERKLQALPAEIEALKVRGAAEVVAEEARIRQGAEGDRQRLLEQARREIELQLRAAERELIKRAAELTVGLASDRIRRTITDEDQQRLVDRYLALLHE
jgi:F-type H+-transporting ATPase subunit b